MTVKVIIYACCIGETSSRQIFKGLQENIAFRVLAANNHPDNRTICRFRADHAEALRGLFQQVLKCANGTAWCRPRRWPWTGPRSRPMPAWRRTGPRNSLTGSSATTPRRSSRRRSERTGKRSSSTVGRATGSPCQRTCATARRAGSTYARATPVERGGREEDGRGGKEASGTP